MERPSNFWTLQVLTGQHTFCNCLLGPWGRLRGTWVRHRSQHQRNRGRGGQWSSCSHVKQDLCPWAGVCVCVCVCGGGGGVQSTSTTKRHTNLVSVLKDGSLSCLRASTINMASLLQISLLCLIDKTGTECLNESDSHPLGHAFTTGEEYLESDCDEQLIVALAFQQPVKLHSLQLVGPTDGQYCVQQAEHD